jgi:putative tricarboxylic transport membrane protein
LRRALAISQGDISIFLTKPISASVLAITAALLIGPAVWKFFAKRRSK